jgi:imidazoleglycerol phosphate dehydratase HisB
MEPIQFIGLNELEKVDQDMVQTLATEYYDKIQRALKNLTSLVIHIKTLEKEGHRHRYEIHVKAVAPTRIFDSSKGKSNTDWDLASALHHAFKSIEHEIEHAFHDQ